MVVNGSNAYVQSSVASAAQANPTIQKQNTSEQRVKENTAQPRQAETNDSTKAENQPRLDQDIAQFSRDNAADQGVNDNDFGSEEGFQAFLSDNGLSEASPRGSVVDVRI